MKTAIQKSLRNAVAIANDLNNLIRAGTYDKLTNNTHIEFVCTPGGKQYEGF
jgi:hypothetical protein